MENMKKAARTYRWSVEPSTEQLKINVVDVWQNNSSRNKEILSFLKKLVDTLKTHLYQSDFSYVLYF